MSEGLSDADLAWLVLEVDLDTIPSAVLRRLIAEVRHEQATDPEPYNRAHNRHNRGGGQYNRSHNRHNRGL